MVKLEPVTGDPAQLKEAYGCFPSGVTALCALDGDEPVGMAASAFTCVSIEPGLVSVCLRNSSSTWPRLRGARRLGVSVLAEHQGDACRALSVKTGDRFAGVDWSAGAAGAVFVPGAVAWLECSTEEELPAGDHTIALLAVHALRIDPGRRPLIFHGSRFGRLLAA
ncbi:flavin reductase family protein [Actinomadura algeriensis]|uniref:Flavin reductase (DIM6/NTAB) family NADH-FMN oxidoreductase RutF n=1 Tax=Actinomadura algeriensis TaxID=1679523 RepID=A0ABR9JUJ3_9ACTN|nr:flavin reductase family protein [Actinomadura algeriensis]MBE1534220.1 flavin reductase (DIM6/NTAB) family NADH-FMN oxidoreductase RutF [Actinomadura algeriensis]